MSLSMHQCQNSNVSSTSSMESAVELSMFRLTVIWLYSSLAALQLLIEPPWVLTHLCVTFSPGLTICRSLSHRGKPHPNPFWMRWWRLLYLEMVAQSTFRLLDVSSSTTIPFLSWRCLLDAFCSRTYLYLLFCKSRISCAWSCEKWSGALHTAGRWDSSTPSSSANVRRNTPTAVRICWQSVRVLFTFLGVKLSIMEFELMMNPRKVITWVGIFIDFSLWTLKPKAVRISIASWVNNTVSWYLEANY